jgi:hypothetical protein
MSAPAAALAESGHRGPPHCGRDRAGGGASPGRQPFRGPRRQLRSGEQSTTLPSPRRGGRAIASRIALARASPCPLISAVLRALAQRWPRSPDHNDWGATPPSRYSIADGHDTMSFFKLLAELMKTNPPYEADAAILPRSSLDIAQPPLREQAQSRSRSSIESIRNRARPPAVWAWRACPQKRSSDSRRRSPP